LRPAQDPVIPLLVGGLIAVSLVAALSIAVWVWAIRRPAPPSAAQDDRLIAEELPPLVYVALGAPIGLGLDYGANDGQSWVELLRQKMPEGAQLLTLGRSGVTLVETNQTEIPAVVEAGPDIVTLWQVVTDAVKGVALADYIKELHLALTAISRGTRATILLLNLPDISLVTEGVSDEQRSLIRGGVVQWNRAISDAVARYGRRVRLVDVFPISEELLVRQEAEGGTSSAAGQVGNALLADIVWQTIEKEQLVEAQ
jgi:hypothetical protein